MKFDITRQQPFSSLTLLVVVSVAGSFLIGHHHAPTQTFAMEALLSGYVNDFQSSHPVWATVATTLLIFFGALRLGHDVSLLKLYGVSTSVQTPILALLSLGMALSEEYLLCGLLLYITSLVISQFFRAIRSGYNLGALFNATMLLSALPLLYPPAVVLLGVIPIMLIVMGVTLREWIIAVTGFLFSPAVAYYTLWLCTGEFVEHIIRSKEMIISFSGLLSATSFSLFPLVTAALVVLLSLVAIAMESMTDKTHNLRARIVVLVVIFLASVTSIFMPSSNLLSLALLTPSAALLTTLFMVRFKGTMANIIYVVIWVLTLLSLVYPIYI